MFKNYFKTGLRSLLRNKIYTLVSISGLAIGIACCFLIGLYIHDEITYDTFFENHENIYRVAVTQEVQGERKSFAVSHIALAPILEEEFPEVQRAARLHRLYFNPEVTVMVGQQSFVETKMYLADNNLFDLLSLQFLEGSPTNALQTKGDIVLTKKIAEKYFGDEPALGKSLKLDFGRELNVSAVVEDLPPNSHFNFEMLAHLEFMQYIRNSLAQPNWTVFQTCTYVKLDNGSSAADFEAKLPGLVERQASDQILSSLGEGAKLELFLQPLSSIHLESQLDAEMQPNGNINYVYILAGLVILILSISCINFVNLATARSTERGKEVGVRKVMGSPKGQLISQFLMEFCLITTISTSVAIGIVLLSLPFFNELIDKSFLWTDLINPSALLLIGLFVLLTGLLAGWYPAVVISSQEAALVLKGKFRSSRKGIGLRNALLAIQFTVSIGLISSTVIINDQLDYLRNKNLGFQKDQILLVKHPLSLGQHDNVEQGDHASLGFAIVAHANQRAEAFKAELRKVEGVVEVGGTFQVMGKRYSSVTYLPDDPNLEQIPAQIQTVDNEFLQAVNIELITGRLFSGEFNESKNVLINETMLLELGWDDPIGRKLTENFGNEQTYEIIGVVKDYHFQSLHQEVGPLVIENGLTSPWYFPTALAVRVNSTNMVQVLQNVEAVWNEFVPNESVNLSFLNDELNLLYAADQTSERIIKIFTSVSITLGCIGLFGLTAFVVQQRTREIGIRRVLGARISSIIFLLSTQFGKVILIAFAVALPLTWFGMSAWLENYAYRVSLGLNPFIFAIGAIGLLSLAIIGFHAIKVIKVNPTNSLKSE